MNDEVGRRTYGAAALLFGAIAFAARDDNAWEPGRMLGSPAVARALFYAVAAAQVLGGLAVQRRRAVRAGAGLLGGVYLVYGLLGIPPVLAKPFVYNTWNNIFEQLAMVAGALIIAATATPDDAAWRRRGLRAGTALFGLSVLSFALEQAFYLRPTAALVPTWIPPGRTFWAVATTAAFALAAVAILSGRAATLAARLFAGMLLLFEALVWLPTLVADPHSRFDWSEAAETLAIAASAWVVAHAVRAIRHGCRYDSPRSTSARSSSSSRKLRASRR